MSAILDEINKSAYLYCESIQDKLEKICNPLSKIGIDNFGYFKIFNDGSFFHIVNNLEYQRDYLFKDGGFGDIHIDVYSNTESKKYFLTPYDKESLKKDRVINIEFYNDMHNVFNIYINKKDYLSGYFFSTKDQDIKDSSFYINNLPLLEHFIEYFNEIAKDLIDVKDKNKLSKFDHKFNFSNNSEVDIDIQKIQEFLQETQLKNFLLTTKNGEVRLSKRQTECLHYLSHGKSAKEIGRILSLSPKTIDFYINNIKKKSEYYSKAELIRGYSKSYLLLEKYEKIY